MSSIRQTKTIYVVKPVYSDSVIDNKEIIGYDTLSIYNNVLVINAYSEIDRSIYGNQFNTVMKFYSKNEFDMDTSIQYGIYLTEPVLSETDSMYHNPTYLTTPLINFDGRYLFDGKKQQY